MYPMNSIRGGDNNAKKKIGARIPQQRACSQATFHVDGEIWDQVYGNVRSSELTGIVQIILTFVANTKLLSFTQTAKAGKLQCHFCRLP